MADNVAITAGSGTTIAADEVTRNAIPEKQQLVKLSYGTDGNYEGMASTTTPFPVGGSTSATLGKAEDAASASGDVGVPPLLRRTDTPAILTSTDGDYTQAAANSLGGQYVDINLGFVPGANQALSILKAEDTAHAAGDAGVAVWGVRRDSAVSLFSAEGDYGPNALNTYGACIANVDLNFQAAVGPGILKAEDAAHSSGDAGVMLLGVRNDAEASSTSANGDYTGLAVDAAGRLKIDPGTAAASLGKAEDAVHASGDVGVMALTVRRDTATALAGTQGDYSPMAVNQNGANYVDIQSGFQSSAATGLLKLEDSSHVTGDAGVMSLAVVNSNNTARASSNGDYVPMAADDAGRIKVIVEPSSEQNGLTTYRNLDVQNTGANIKGTGGKLHDLLVTNLDATTIYLKIYDKSSTPTSSDTPIFTIAVPPSWIQTFSSTQGLDFSNGIGIRATTGISDGNTTSPGTNEVIVNIGYV